MKDKLSYALYPDVFEGYLKYISICGDLSRMGSDIYFHGLSENETCEIEVSKGKRFIIRLVKIGKLDVEGNRKLFFEVDGFRREIKIRDKNSRSIQDIIETKIADVSNEKEIGSPIPGTIISILVKEGDKVEKNDALIVVEAMKMETRVTASISGTVGNINVKEEQQVSAGELLITFK